MAFEDLELNERATESSEDLLADPESANVEVHEISGANVVDCGVHVPASLFAARCVAEVCIANSGIVTFTMDRLADRPVGKVVIEMDDPVIGCLLSQYAGWKIQSGDYFAMGSGPMRALAAREPLFSLFKYKEEGPSGVGVLESNRLPDEDVVSDLAGVMGIEASELTLLVAPTASIVGSFQIVARSVETCLHKLLELGFDVTRIRSAIGSAFLPPIPKDDLVAIGRTNDSILFGGEVILWVEGDDDTIATVGKQVPSSTSRDYGRPFAEVFKSHDGDFYRIDPLLFSPASVTFNNLSTGSQFHFGKVDHGLLVRSFFGA